MSGTPRTDAVSEMVDRIIHCDEDNGEIVPAHLARTLECELTESRQRCERYEAHLRDIVELSAGWDDDGSTGPRKPLSWESVGRVAMDYARAALNQLEAERDAGKFALSKQDGDMNRKDAPAMEMPLEIVPAVDVVGRGKVDQLQRDFAASRKKCERLEVFVKWVWAECENCDGQRIRDAAYKHLETR